MRGIALGIVVRPPVRSSPLVLKRALTIESSKPPTIEVDWEALAAYIRFRTGKVAQTVPRDGGHCFIAVDLDSKGRVLGVDWNGRACWA